MDRVLDAIHHIAERHCLERDEFQALGCQTQDLLLIQKEEVRETLQSAPAGQRAHLLALYYRLCTHGDRDQTHSQNHLLYSHGMCFLAIAITMTMTLLLAIN